MVSVLEAFLATICQMATDLLPKKSPLLPRYFVCYDAGCYDAQIIMVVNLVTLAYCQINVFRVPTSRMTDRRLQNKL